MSNQAATAEGPRRTRVLFVAEAMTLCHVSRPLVLASALDPGEYDTHVACSARYHRLYAGVSATLHDLQSVPSEQAVESMARGKPLFSEETLRRYVEEDLAILGAVTPDVVVGDMRLSLAVSARRAGIPYVAIFNAYWSPYARQRFVVPQLPLTRRLGPALANLLFRAVRPVAMGLHCRPLNRVRKAYGQRSLGWDLRRVYTEADLVLYPDVPELVPTCDLPPSHHYLGPILWSVPGDLPAWWSSLPMERPVVSVSLGSSGQASLLQNVLDALADLPVTVLAGTSGRFTPSRVPPNAFVAEFLPGREASARASLLISHGGSAPAYVALAAGTPVLGIPSNMDQFLTMDYIQAKGAGKIVRAEYATVERIRKAADELLNTPSYRNAAGTLAQVFAEYAASERFKAVLSHINVGTVQPSAPVAVR
jgi:UDP:flavonoid glycosyltransferase YjiC (YdhE family)